MVSVQLQPGNAVRLRKRSASLTDSHGQIFARAEAWLAHAGRWRAAMAAVFLLQFALILTHRPWVDEWQALQIALQTPTLSSLIDNLRYEGHPPLWYLLLRGAAWILPTFWILPVVAASLAAVSQAIVLTKTPFLRIERILLSLGTVMLFEYLTIARGTTLGVALVLVAMAMLRSRWCWVAITLLPMVDLPFGVLSMVLIVLLARDRRLWIPGLAAWLFCSCVAAWSVIPAPDMVPANQLNIWWFDAYQWIERLGFLLIPFQTLNNHIRWEGFLPFKLGIVCGPLFLWFAYRQNRHDPLHLALYGGLLVLSLAFSIAVYPQHVRHLAVLVLPLYLLKWRDREANLVADRSFQLWLAAGAICGLIVATANFVRPFDNAHLAAEYIEANDLTAKHWVVYPENRAQGISALTGISFERVGQDCTQTLVRWNKRSEFYDFRDLKRYLRLQVERNGRFYFMTDFPVDPLPRSLIRTLAAFTGSYGGQRYYLNVVGPGLTEKKWDLPACVPGLVPLVRPTRWSSLKFVR